MFKRIVAAIDRDVARSEQVMTTVEGIAQKFASEVLVVHVRDVERRAALAAGGKPGALPPSVHADPPEEGQELVATAVQRLRAAGVRVRGEIGPSAGSTARELLDFAQDHQADLIVVGDRDSRVSDVILGGVAHRIVHLADCPVLLVR